MLETKNLCKIYKPKKGVPVKALDNLTLKFPDRGMIFILGKSGSGKSTLLNVLGGLDRYDGGEIIIKGVSSASFRQEHFDSYRNTYVGFIFQEYNILNEFTVGANIALAIELQGRKAEEQDINTILSEVDLAGYGNRKPNELSGGQKQRVAIARALVKNPEIIMADEPTGALDSATGRQVLNTLKKLSSDKLVIVVSHDREFAEKYADRIIELSDGKVLSDVEVSGEMLSAEDMAADAALTYEGNSITVPNGYHLTEKDREQINAYLDGLKNGNVRLVAGDSSEKSGKRFTATDVTKITDRNSTPFKLIKSKLPMKNAFRIGADGLKYKKVKLVFTVILSCIAFTLFGLADTFGSYNHINACTQSIVDSGIEYAAFKKEYKRKSGTETYWQERGKLTAAELQKITEGSGVTVQGVYVPRTKLSLENIDTSVELSKGYSVYPTGFSGFAGISESLLKDFGYKLLAGKLPDGSKNEIAVSDFIYATFAKTGYIAGGETAASKVTISGYSDLCGKVLNVGGTEYTVTGIVNTGFDYERYLPLTEDMSTDSTADRLVKYALYNEMIYYANYSLCGVIMVGDGFIDRYTAKASTAQPIDNASVYYYQNESTVQTKSENSFMYFVSDGVMTIDPYYADSMKNLSRYTIDWVDGAKTSLAENEIIISSDMLMMNGVEYNAENKAEILKTLAGTEFERSLYQYEVAYQSADGQEPSVKTKIVGVIDVSAMPDASVTILTDDTTFAKLVSEPEGGIYDFAVGAMPKGKQEVRNTVKFAYDTTGEVRYTLRNSVSYELDTVNQVLKVLASVFFYIGIGFAVFAAVLMANFIATSISYKKQEIGILRAIGSRSMDVFRIFFSESFIIAMINFVLSMIGTLSATLIINYVIRSQTGILLTILNFGIRQIGLLLLISVAVAAVASFLPVRKIAAKRPIDAIRNR